MRLNLLIILFFFATAYSAIPDSTDLPLISNITKDGITWEFKQPVRAGQFVNGDYYIVGNATITKITPAPENGRNGSVLNPSLDAGISGFDDRVESNRFREELRVYPPIDIKPGDELISSISIDSIGSITCWLRSSDIPPSPVKSVSILTCLKNTVAEDAFRPSYGDTTRKIYYASNLRRNLLPRLNKVGAEPDIADYAEHFRRPWLDVCYFFFDAAVEYQPAYGRELGRAIGMAALLLSLDYSPEEKEPLLIGFVQYGIDLWGMARNGYRGWPAIGGYGQGRKLPIIIAGLLLGDNEMVSPTKTYPDLQFGEDMQTIYGTSWTGANVVYAGHQGVFKGQVVSTKEGWGPYEQLPPSEWVNNTGESYRRCCTSISWIGEALAARIFGVMDDWDHPAFFDYCDRWMTENDSAFVRIIYETKGWDYNKDWARQGQCWDKFVEDMWVTYRNNAVPVQNLIKKSDIDRKKPGIKRIFTGLGSETVSLPAKYMNKDNSGMVRIYNVAGKNITTVPVAKFQKILSGKSLPAGLLFLDYR